MFSTGAANAGLVRQTSGYALGVSAALEGRVGWVEARECEEVFFVTFVVSLVSMIVLRKEKGNMRRSAGACMVYVAING